MIRRRARALRPEELRLWGEIARSVAPLPGREAPAPPAEAPSAPPAPAAAASAGAAPVPRAPPPASRPVLPPLAPLERGTARALARGRARPDAVLDLHGLTQADAHRRLGAFLRGCQASGHGLVLVITGQGGPPGGGAAGERGVLRRVVPHWLRLPEMRALVLGFEQAGPRQGGAGALHVRIRRARPRP